MPYNIYWKNKGVRWKFSGAVTSKETLQSNMDIYGDPRFDSLRYQIADFREVERITFNEMDMKKIAYLDQAAAKSNPRIKVAIVSPVETIRAMMEVYAKYSMANPWQTKLFDSIDEAEAWLHHQLHIEIS